VADEGENNKIKDCHVHHFRTLALI
jgi:hypothetical protein